MTIKDIACELMKNIGSTDYANYLAAQDKGDYQEGFLQGYNYAVLLMLLHLTSSSNCDIIEEKKGDK